MPSVPQKKSFSPDLVAGALACGFSRRALADALGIDLNALRDVASGRTRLTRRQELELERLTGLPASRIVLRGLVSSARGNGKADAHVFRETDNLLRVLSEATTPLGDGQRHNWYSQMEPKDLAELTAELEGAMDAPELKTSTRARNAPSKRRKQNNRSPREVRAARGKQS